MKKLGTVIKVKKGVCIPDLNIDQTGWCGRITYRGVDQMLGAYYEVEWDSITLQNIGFKSIFRMYKNDIDWRKSILGREEINKTKERDTIEDTKNQVLLIQQRIQNKKNHITSKFT